MRLSRSSRTTAVALLILCSPALVAAPPESSSPEKSAPGKASEPETAAKEKSEPAAAPDYKALRLKAVGQKLETLDVRGKIYKKVVVKGVDDIGVRIMHEAGSARIPFPHLSAVLRKRFGFNPGAIISGKVDEKNADTARGRQLAEQKRILREKREARYREAAKEKEIEDVERSIRSYEAKIRKLEVGITQAKAEISSLRSRASRAAAEAYYTVNRVDSRGVVQSQQRVNKGKLARAASYRKRADAEQLKIDQANTLIRSHRQKLSDLRRQQRKSK